MSRSAGQDWAISHLDTGSLVPLKTTLELRAGEELIEVYITCIPVQLANAVLQSLRAVFNEEGPLNLQHVRRIARLSDLPPDVLALISPRFSCETAQTAAERPPICLLVAPKHRCTVDELMHCFTACTSTASLELATILIPAVAPTSAARAADWSAQYWPCVYKKSNPFAPHAAIFAKQESILAADANTFMSLARDVGAATSASRMGLCVGAVVVARPHDGADAAVVVVASDARWKDVAAPDPQHHVGNVTCHAVLRAIGMVGRKLVAARQPRGDSSVAKDMQSTNLVAASEDVEAEFFGDLPLLPIEKAVFARPNLAADGYLCNGLELYLTHEPCVMCTMAIVHSRFSKVVFEQRMPETGALTAERGPGRGLGYGLWWRKELNWSLLAWEWVRNRPSESSGGRALETPLASNIHI